MANKKIVKKGTFQLRPSTWFLILLVFFALTHPIIPDILYIPMAVIGFFLLRKKQMVKPFKAIDFLLIMLYLIIFFVLYIYLELISFKTIPWYLIIIMGVIADVVATVLGSVPVIGDALSGMINLFLPIIIIGGFTGLMLGIALMVISLIPGPSMGANTVALIAIKAVSLII